MNPFLKFICTISNAGIRLVLNQKYLSAEDEYQSKVAYLEGETAVRLREGIVLH